MTILSFKELFAKVLLPLFSPDHFEKFCEGAEYAYKRWLDKFKKEHKLIEQLNNEAKVS